MTDKWYLVPATGNGSMTDPYQPILADSFDGFSGYHLEEEDLYLVRYFGNFQAYNALEGVRNAKQLSEQETVTRLNGIFGESRSLDEWNSQFQVGEE